MNECPKSRFSDRGNVSLVLRLSAISRFMRVVFLRFFCAVIALMLAVVTPLYAQSDPFRWMDFHSQKDQDIIVWVTRSLSEQDWTAIREIGVQYDAALVVTTMRPTPQSPANADTFTVWSVSLTSHVVAPLLKGVNLRWLERMRFAPGAPLEPAILYDNCRDCSAQTYFTAFYYDLSHHMWAARWLRGSDAAPVWAPARQPASPGPRFARRWPIPTDGNWWAPGTTLTTETKSRPRIMFTATIWTPRTARSGLSC